MIASIDDADRQRENIYAQRMSEMAAIMNERECQAYERFKLKSEILYRRDTEANKRMGDLMTTMKDLTLTSINESNVMIHPCGLYAECQFASKDTLTSVGEDGTVFLAVRNKTAVEHDTVKTKTVIGTCYFCVRTHCN